MKSGRKGKKATHQARLAFWSSGLALWMDILGHEEIVRRSPSVEDGLRVVESRQALRNLEELIRELAREKQELERKGHASQSSAVARRIAVLKEEIETSKRSRQELQAQLKEERSPFDVERQLGKYLIHEVVISMLDRVLVQGDSSPWSYNELAAKVTESGGRYADFDEPDGEVANEIQDARKAESERAAQAVRQRLMRHLPRIAAQYELFDIESAQSAGAKTTIRPSALLIRLYCEVLAGSIDERLRLAHSQMKRRKRKKKRNRKRKE